MMVSDDGAGRLGLLHHRHSACSWLTSGDSRFPRAVLQVKTMTTTVLFHTPSTISCLPAALGSNFVP